MYFKVKKLSAELSERGHERATRAIAIMPVERRCKFVFEQMRNKKWKNKGKNREESRYRWPACFE